MISEEKEAPIDWFKKELDETCEKLNKEESENRQLKEVIVSMALEIHVLRDMLEHKNNY